MNLVFIFIQLTNIIYLVEYIFAFGVTGMNTGIPYKINLLIQFTIPIPLNIPKLLKDILLFIKFISVSIFSNT